MTARINSSDLGVLFKSSSPGQQLVAPTPIEVVQMQITHLLLIPRRHQMPELQVYAPKDRTVAHLSKHTPYRLCGIAISAMLGKKRFPGVPYQ